MTKQQFKLLQAQHDQVVEKLEERLASAENERFKLQRLSEEQLTTIVELTNKLDRELHDGFAQSEVLRVAKDETSRLKVKVNSLSQALKLITNLLTE